MIEQPPKGLSLKARVKWFMDRDPTTARDAEVFKSRWGEYPAGYSRQRQKFQPDVQKSQIS